MASHASIPFFSIFSQLLTMLLVARHLLGPSVLVDCDEQLIRSTCTKTHYPDLCVSVLVANASSLSTDLRGLATISTGALLGNTTDAKSYVREFARRTNDTFLKKVLKDCVYDYRVGVRNLLLTLACLEAMDLPGADASVVVAMQMSGGCRDAFSIFNLTYLQGISAREEGIGKLTVTSKGIIDLLIMKPE